MGYKVYFIHFIQIQKIWNLPLTLIDTALDFKIQLLFKMILHHDT